MAPGDMLPLAKLPFLNLLRQCHQLKAKCSDDSLWEQCPFKAPQMETASSWDRLNQWAGFTQRLYLYSISPPPFSSPFLKTTPHSINYLSAQLSGAKKMFMFMTLMLWLVLILIQFFYDIKH